MKREALFRRETRKALTVSGLRKTPVIRLYDDDLQLDNLQTILAALKSQFIAGSVAEKRRNRVLTHRHEKGRKHDTTSVTTDGQEGRRKRQWERRRRGTGEY